MLGGREAVLPARERFLTPSGVDLHLEEGEGPPRSDRGGLEGGGGVTGDDRDRGT